MRISLSWSGDRSHAMANALREWLPAVLQAARPWMSSADVAPGSRWGSEIALELQESRCGIICLTPDNLDAPWVMFEAGALSHTLERTLVIPYLLGVQPADLSGPLVQFQVATATRDGTFHMVKGLNRALGDSAVSDTLLDRTFEMWWPHLERELGAVLSAPDSERETTKPLAKRDLAGSRTPRLSETKAGRLLELVKKVSASPMSQEESAQIVDRDSVFVVHGHDHGTMESVARFIERLGAVAIVLHEQPNEGRTVIEKFEVYSNARYAVVLLTGDDAVSGTGPHGQRRARQNVILELGYFLAKLGRSRVCVVHQPGVEVPSDISGLLYIPLDKEGAWKFRLARELKTAGVRVDLNNAV